MCPYVSTCFGTKNLTLSDGDMERHREFCAAYRRLPALDKILLIQGKKPGGN